MKMQKFFRKYQKPLMGILGAVLIVGWLVGDAIQNLFSKKPITTLAQTTRFGKITSADSDMADGIQKLIGMLNTSYNWRSPVDGGRLPQPPLEMVDWIVLNKEIEQNGFKLTSDSVAGQFDEPTAQEALAVAAHTNRIRKDDLLSAQSQAVALQAMADFSSAGSTPSLAEVRQLGQRTLEKTKINAVVLPAAAFEDEAATFTDEQIAAQFAAAKDNEAGAGLDFGYVLEDAVKIEYIEVDRKVIEQNLTVDAAKIEREAKKYWEENRTAPAFRRPKEEPKPEEKPAVDANAADPSASSPAPEEKTEPAPDAAKPDATAPEAPKPDAPPPAPAADPAAGKPEGGPGGPRAVEPVSTADMAGFANAPDTTTITFQEEPLKPAEKPAEKPAQPPAETPAPAKPAESNPAEPTATTQPPGATAQPPFPPLPPTGAPGQPPAAPAIAYFESWEEAKEAAIKHIRQQYTGAKALEITTWLAGRLDEPWIGIKANADGFKPAPDTVKTEGYYAHVIEQAVKALGYAEALKPGKTEFFTRSQSATLPGGLATAMHFEAGRSRAMSLANLAFNVEGLTTIPEGADRFVFLSQMQTSRFALTAVTEGKSYLFRVVEVRPSRPPQSVDEVRDRVVKDLRIKAAFEAARKQADELLAAAKATSLKEAYDADEALVALKDKNVTFLDPLPFARMTSAFAGDLANRGNVGIAGLGSIKPELADRIFALAAAADHREVIPLEDRASVLVVEWKETLPARIDDFDRFRTQQTARLASIRASNAKREFLRPSNVRARAGVEERK